MTGALIILAVTVGVGAVLYILHKVTPDNVTDAKGKEEVNAGSDTEECCGRHVVCDRRDILPDDVPLYFDDEELDRFAGRDPGSYEDAEIQEFRDVLYTLLPEDIYPWGVALTRRDIALPLILRDEWIMLCNENA